jgi:cytochrome c-type biogenesis protein CcmH
MAFRRLGFLATFLVVLAGCAPDDVATRRARAVHEVESRLFAPCCWTQTVDVHASPLADELRTEITTRLGAGEAPRAVEDDLAARYGERIRAVPRDVPSQWLGAPIVLALALGLVALWGVVRSVRRRAGTASGPATASAVPGHGRVDEEREDRLDDELLELD